MDQTGLNPGGIQIVEGQWIELQGPGGGDKKT
jgi:hypothetical protein